MKGNNTAVLFKIVRHKEKEKVKDMEVKKIRKIYFFPEEYMLSRKCFAFVKICPGYLKFKVGLSTEQ